MRKADACEDCAILLEVGENTSVTDVVNLLEETMDHMTNKSFSLEVIELDGKTWACFKHD